MRRFKLKRVSYISDGTFGVLIDKETPFCLTLECEWNNNKRGESCIPADTYICKRTQSPKFGDTFEITNVPGRSHVLFHWGAIEDDSHGCVIVGEQYGKVYLKPDFVKSKNGLLASGKAFKEFKQRTKSINKFELEIVDCNMNV